MLCFLHHTPLRDRHLHTLDMHRLYGLAWGAVACFIVEYIGLFSGVSIFFKGHACAFILLHFVGAVLTAMYYTNVSSRSGR